MALDPQVKTFLEEAAAANLPPYHTMSLSEARVAMMERSARFLADPPTLAAIGERSIDGPGGPLRVRIYTPEGEPPFPLLVYFHGGGWVLGSLDSHDSLCRALAKAASCVVVSVDYRLAPEHRFPAQVEDAYAATVWASNNAGLIGGIATKVAVGGDSAGGAMAAAVTLMARDRGGPPLAAQLLIYPVTDFGFDTASYSENATGYQLTKVDMVWFWNHYLSQPDDGRHPYAAPLRAERLDGLPPAVVITAEYDPLRDEGEAYARRLREAGVRARLSRYDGVIHNFVRMFPILDRGRDAVDEVGRSLRQLLEAAERNPGRASS